MTKKTTESFELAKPGEIRTRFAPSPTGFLHIGGLRTALFNYLFAKKHQGLFVLRIEDTDVERSDPEYEKDILEELKWLKIDWDEGPDADGFFGPYRQSERLDIYEKYLQKLLDENKAYYCFCSEEDLEAQRQYQLSLGEAPHYNGKCANLSKEEVKKRIKDGESCIIRFRITPKKVKFHDLVRGDVEFDSALFGDTVIAKGLKSPLYNFATVIDDYEMRINHVIRGEEHLSNTPKQILIHEALSLPQPKYAHIPLILAPDKTKLSKRQGTTAVCDFRNEGYLPETIINFIAFLGWNPGDEREIYSLASLMKEFDIERVQKAGAIFNIKRLDYLNGFYIRNRSLEKITEFCLPHMIENGLIKPVFKTEQYPPAYGAMEISQGFKILETNEDISFDSLQKIVSLYKERLKKLSEISELTDFFFKDNLEYEKDLLKWKDMKDSEIKDSLKKLEKIFDKIKEKEWKKENLENVLLPEAEKMGDRGELLWPMRAALTGKKASAGPFEVAEILGKEKSIKRIKNAKEKYA
ncbi:glutamate--tRNA ligase [Patescibacteria group bacterium]